MAPPPPPICSYVLTNSIYLVGYHEGNRALISSLDDLLMRLVELACTLLYNAGLNSPFFGMLSPPLPLLFPTSFIFLTRFSVQSYVAAIECRFLVYVLFVSAVVLVSEVCFFLYFLFYSHIFDPNVSFRYLSTCAPYGTP
jgi:hypothetical protein